MCERTLVHSRVAAQPGLPAVLLRSRAFRTFPDDGPSARGALVVFHPHPLCRDTSLAAPFPTRVPHRLEPPGRTVQASEVPAHLLGNHVPVLLGFGIQARPLCAPGLTRSGSGSGSAMLGRSVVADSHGLDRSWLAVAGGRGVGGLWLAPQRRPAARGAD